MVIIYLSGGTLVNFSLLSHIFSGKLVSMSLLSPSLVMILALDNDQEDKLLSLTDSLCPATGPPNSSQFAAWGDFHN